MDNLDKIFIQSKNKQHFTFAIKVTTSAKNNDINGIIWTNNVCYLKIMVKEIPENGKANLAIIDFLSKKWSVPKKLIKIIKGHKSSQKILTIGIDDLKYIQL